MCATCAIDTVLLALINMIIAVQPVPLLTINGNSSLTDAVISACRESILVEAEKESSYIPLYLLPIDNAMNAMLAVNTVLLILPIASNVRTTTT